MSRLNGGAQWVVLSKFTHTKIKIILEIKNKDIPLQFKSLQMEPIDTKVKRAEIKERLSKAKVEQINSIINGIDCLESLLSATKPGEKHNPLSEITNWIPVISQPWQIEIVEKKIVELINKL